ncbi:MAG: ribonuclease P protein component 4 [Promethearchaeota archaeon]
MNSDSKDSSINNCVKKNIKKKRKSYKEYKKNRYKRAKEVIKQIALERIEYLMELALKIYPDCPELANRYVIHARNYSMAAQVRIPKKYKRYICHKCKKLMVPGYSCRIRIKSCKGRGSHLIITCLNCNNIIHQIYFKAKKSSKGISQENRKIAEINESRKDTLR